MWRSPLSPTIQILAGTASAETPLPPEQRPAFLWAESVARSRLRTCHPGQSSMKPVACKPFLKRQLFSQVEYELQNTVCVKQNIAYKRGRVLEWNAGRTKPDLIIRFSVRINSKSFVSFLFCLPRRRSRRRHEDGCFLNVGGTLMPPIIDSPQIHTDPTRKIRSCTLSVKICVYPWLKF